MTTRHHLDPIEPASAIAALCERIAREIPRGAYGAAAHRYYGVEAELNAFAATRTPWLGRRLANALRHVMKRSDLAAEVEALLPPVPRPIKEEGTLHMQPSGRWAVCRPGRDPYEITSGEVFRVEVEGREGLQRTRMEHAHPGGYYAVDGYPLRDGLRAALGMARIETER
jgi:hypothetical protein